MGNVDTLYLNLAKIEASKSKDPSTKTGCIIINKNNSPIGYGFNDWISDCNTTFMTFERPHKYFMILHSEMKAILSADREKLKGATLYCTHSPCSNCLKHILEVGITRIVFEELCPSVTRYTRKELERETIIRLLKSMPHVVCVDSNRKAYLDILGETLA